MRVAATGLSHRFPGREPLFNNVSFEWHGGDLVALTGPSGCGKTTLLTIVAGWVKPTSEMVSRTQDSRVSWVAQNPHGSGRRTALDHVVLPLLAQGMRRNAAEADATEIMETFHLAEVTHRDFRLLSGGEAQRLMLASAVAYQPHLLLVDEPTAQLDPANAHSVIATLGALASDDRIVVVATHDPRVRKACSTTIALGAT